MCSQSDRWVCHIRDQLCFATVMVRLTDARLKTQWTRVLPDVMCGGEIVNIRCRTQNVGDKAAEQEGKNQDPGTDFWM